MTINRLIAMGGTGVKSPVRRYLETKASMGAMERNKLAMLSQKQQMGYAQNQESRANQAFMSGQFDKASAQVAPIYDQINRLGTPEEKQAALSQNAPQIQKIYDNAGVGEMVKGQIGQWDQGKSDAFLNRYLKKEKAPTTRTVMEGAEKVQQEWNPRKRTWTEVGRGISSSREGGPGATFGDPSKKNLSDINKERVDSYANLQKQLRGYDTIEELITNPNFTGGATGKAISMINSAVAQYKQATGENSAMVGDKVDLKVIDPKSSLFSRLRKSAIISDAEEAATVELAYILAKGNDQGGRVTDKDYDAASRMMGTTSDPKSRQEMLNRRRKEVVNSFNDMEKALGRQYKGYQQNPYDLPKEKPQPKVGGIESLKNEIYQSYGVE